MPAVLAVTALALAALIAPLPAGAQPGSDSPALSIDDAIRLLDAATADEIRMGIETLGATGSPRAIQPIADRILKGLPPALLDVCLDALLVLARPEAGPVLFELVSHRRAAVRARAIEIIVAARPRGADRALALALNDSDPRVRGTAATGLGQVGSAASLDPLYSALDRGMLEAAPSIALVVPAEDIGRLLGYLGRIPFASFSPALEQLLARRNIPERAKLEVIARLGELATPEVRSFLEAFLATLPEDPRGRDPIRRAVTEAISRIAG